MSVNITGIILAGGDNTRFNGKTKSNVVIGGRTIISRMIGTLDDIFEEIIIVTNKPGDFSDYDNYKMTGDHFLKKGPLGGIHAALNASSREAVFIFAGDMPLLNKKLILKQIKQYNETRPDIFIPRIDENIEPLHGIYNQSVRSTLEEYLSGTSLAVRDFFKQVNVTYMELEESDETKHAFMNINYPSDIQAVEKIIKLHHY